MNNWNYREKKKLRINEQWTWFVVLRKCHHMRFHNLSQIPCHRHKCILSRRLMPTVVLAPHLMFRYLKQWICHLVLILKCVYALTYPSREQNVVELMMQLNLRVVSVDHKFRLEFFSEFLNYLGDLRREMSWKCKEITNKQETPTTPNATTAVAIPPVWCARTAKKFVLTKYPIESGMNTVPICHF